MKTLVTGGAGFIGSHIVDGLIAAGHETAVIDNLSTGLKENLNPKAKFYQMDITDREAVKKVFQTEMPEAVFHLAAQASVPHSVKEPAEDVRINVIGIINLLEAASNAKTKKFVFSSTGGALYGDDVPRPTVEEAKIAPISPYGIDKLFSETYMGYFASLSAMKMVRLRYSNVYGPRQNPLGEAGVIAIFGAKMLKNEEYLLFGTGEQTRDYVFVGDVVRANLAALEREVTGAYNVATAKETSLNEIVKNLRQITATTAPEKKMPERKEQMYSCLSIDKATRELGWSPQVALADGLKQTVEYIRKNLK